MEDVLNANQLKTVLAVLRGQRVSVAQLDSVTMRVTSVATPAWSFDCYAPVTIGALGVAEGVVGVLGEAPSPVGAPATKVRCGAQVGPAVSALGSTGASVCGEFWVTGGHLEANLYRVTV